MSRPSKDQYFLNIAEAVSARSTCLRHKFGAIAVYDGHILATGYNGSPSGMPDCLTLGCIRDELNIPSGTRHEQCITGETVIKLLDGSYRTIEDLAGTNEDSFWVYSVNTKGHIVPALAVAPRQTDTVTRLCEVLLDNGAVIRCTPNHRFLMKDLTYKEAASLKPCDPLTPMYYNFFANDGHESVSNVGKPSKYRKTYQTRTQKLVYDATRIISVPPTAVYDMSVPNYENFAVDLGDRSCIFIHNCRAIHGEQNVIIQAALHGVSIKGSTIYCNGIPCIICAKMLINAKIVRFVASNEDYPDKSGVELLKSAGVEVAI